MILRQDHSCASVPSSAELIPPPPPPSLSPSDVSMAFSPPVPPGIRQSKRETGSSAVKVRVEEWQRVATLG